MESTYFWRPRDNARSVNDEEIIAVLRRIYESLNCGDFDSAIELVHPDFELVRAGGLPSIKGAAAVREWIEPDAIEEQQIEPLEFIVNGDKVLVRHHATGRGAGSGIELDFHMPGVWTVDADGSVMRAQAFLPHQEAEALEAAGLSE